MLSKEEKKAAIAKFKERKVPVGIYAVRCAGRGVWVGASRNLDATRSGLWFSLRIGAHREAALQQAWNAAGEASFQYEVLEVLDEELTALAVADALKERKQHWVVRLNASALL